MPEKPRASAFTLSARIRRTRVDPVGRFAGRDDAIDERARGRDARAIFGGKLKPCRPLVDVPQLRERQRAGLNPHYGCSIMGKRRPCSRAQSIAI
jgi:hypothetical protein